MENKFENISLKKNLGNSNIKGTTTYDNLCTLTLVWCSIAQSQSQRRIMQMVQYIYFRKNYPGFNCHENVAFV